MVAISSIRLTAPVIETRKMVKTFPSGREVIQVLDGVDFKLERGKTASIRGESGSGKTTFLNIISGLEAVDSGQLFWDGNRVDLRSSGELAAVRSSQMGLIFQAYYLLPELNLWENVLLAARLRRKPGTRERDRAKYLLRRVGLAERFKFSVEKLSGGERQRAALARALMNRPKLILADEPTGNLDETTGDSMIELLLEMVREEGSSLILVTHNMKHAAKTDVCYRLHLGKLQPVKHDG